MSRAQFWLRVDLAYTHVWRFQKKEGQDPQESKKKKENIFFYV